MKVCVRVPTGETGTWNRVENDSTVVLADSVVREESRVTTILPERGWGELIAEIEKRKRRKKNTIEREMKKSEFESQTHMF